MVQREPERVIPASPGGGGGGGWGAFIRVFMSSVWGRNEKN